MKKKLLATLLFLAAHTIYGQVVITAGAQVAVSGNVELTLMNTDFVNNGSFSAGTGIVRFTGNASSSISGTQPVQFYQLDINKSSVNPVLLQRAISITQQLHFTTGLLDLNGFNIDLGTT